MRKHLGYVACFFMSALMFAFGIYGLVVELPKMEYQWQLQSLMVGEMFCAAITAILFFTGYYKRSEVVGNSNGERFSLIGLMGSFSIFAILCANVMFNK